eukprot:TRINITY_DN63_c0_g2_i1.p1 TRINITY_DN63_c0_g2~~TRINITY_DN63_c0_g2_i1.p1  ORF type:complete len:173 (+),score=76.67 TRINITY_DN63_c0_g2_i1:64-582(+)
MMKAVCLFAMVAVASGKGIEVSRTVTHIIAGGAGQLFASPGCKTTDEYGSNDCSFTWGQSLTVNANATLPEAISTGTTVDVDLKIDGLISFKVTCPVCGGFCAFEVPVVKKPVNVTLPDCPLVPAGPYTNTTTVELPSDDPSPVSASFKGTATLKDPSGTVLLAVDLNGKLS